MDGGWIDGWVVVKFIEFRKVNAKLMIAHEDEHRR